MEVNELERIHKVVLPLLLRMNQNSQKNRTKLKSFYDLLTSIEKTFGFKNLVDVKKLMQSRKYETMTERKIVDIVENIFRISANLVFYFTTVAYYYDFYKKKEIEEKVVSEMDLLFDEIRAANPLIVGFSVMEVQRTFSIWAAKILREKYKGTIMFGGSDLSLNTTKYMEEYDNIDFVCWADGEYTVEMLIKAVKNKQNSFDEIPNLIYRDGADLIKTDYQEYPIGQYNYPIYEGFPLELYIFPGMQILTSKGCAWSKCKFCMHWNSYGQNFRQREPKDVVDEMEEAYKKYNTRLFSIVDEAISADFGSRLSQEIINRGLDIRWIQMSRLDSDFNEEVFKKMHQAGARLIEWGLETGSQKVLNDMCKGIDVREVQRLIHESASAGIVNKMLMFHNYPIEDVEDLMKSINIIKKNTYFHLLKPMLTLRHSFVLKLGSPLAQIAFDNLEEKPKYFQKVWKPESVYNVNAKYISSLGNNLIKKNLVEDYLNEMKSYLKKNNVLITDNNNITMDLVLVDLVEKGYDLPVDVYLPRKDGGVGEYVLMA
ncbi:MAG: Radical SAM superfamily protein [Firmicutes bacterium ADurb.Bin419]|nr:MAG: Radical SAM superfamily protein [Firmicutes bacterium ADurb.Bin419]